MFLILPLFLASLLSVFSHYLLCSSLILLSLPLCHPYELEINPLFSVSRLLFSHYIDFWFTFLSFIRYLIPLHSPPLSILFHFSNPFHLCTRSPSHSFCSILHFSTPSLSLPSSTEFCLFSYFFPRLHLLSPLLMISPNSFHFFIFPLIYWSLFYPSTSFYALYSPLPHAVSMLLYSSASSHTFISSSPSTDCYSLPLPLPCTRLYLLLFPHLLIFVLFL